MVVLELLSLLIPFATAIYRDNSRTLRTLPAFTNSLVNLGKMDLSFYFMFKPDDFKKYDNLHHRPSGFFSPKIESIVEEPCPCMSKYSRSLQKNNPSDILKKILTSNDLFTFNKEPEMSALCCESHENVHEETVFFELNPKPSPVKDVSVQQTQLPFLPFIFENLGTNKVSMPPKSNAVEIFFFPKKTLEKSQKKEHNKESIQAVGDKELRNDFKTMNLMPPYAGQPSVKKDLAQQDKQETLTTKAAAMKQVTTAANINML